MKIILAAPRGFCAGVNRAIQILTQVCEENEGPIYVLHEIVHNTWVVNSFRERGVIFVNDLSEIPEGSTVLFSAHGVSPAIREAAAKRSLTMIDATCPLVGRVHQMARKYAAEGFHIFLIGHPGHQEVIGTMGEASEKMTLVATASDARSLTLPPSADPSRLTYLMQTTLSDEQWSETASVLRKRFPSLIDPPNAGICFATRNRQQAVRTLAPEADIVLVVGSPNSSNSKRLAEIGGKFGKPSFLIDGPDQIDFSWFTQETTVLMTAGASAPEDVLNRCVAALAEHFDVTLSERVICEENISFKAKI